MCMPHSTKTSGNPISRKSKLLLVVLMTFSGVDLEAL